jgi:hypothetical protein
MAVLLREKLISSASQTLLLLPIQSEKSQRETKEPVNKAAMLFALFGKNLLLVITFASVFHLKSN